MVFQIIDKSLMTCIYSIGNMLVIYIEMKLS